MDSVRSTFHTQLAAVMDSLLAAAVCEIAKIFESSMCEQQAEISSLLAKLEQVERKQRTKTERDGTSAEGGNTTKSKPMTEAGKEPNGENTSSEQKEVTDSLTSIKHEQSPCEGSQLPLASLVVKVPDESIDIPDQRTRLPTDTHVYVKVCQRDEVTQVEDHQSQQERASPPFLTITQSGRCPPRHDPSQAQPSQWPLVLDNTQGRMGGPEGLQATSVRCLVAAATSTYLRPESSKEEDDPLLFMGQKPDKHNSNQASEQGQKAEQTEAQQHQLQAVSPCEHSDDERGSFNHIRRTLFSNKDPQCLQPNSQSLRARPANPLSFDGASSGGSSRPYTCPYCTKSFTYPSHQRRHLLRHTGIRLHPCQFCDKSFLTPSELTVHTRTHTGERPFSCLQCGKRFARSGNLRAHQRDVHMRKRPFACAECGKRFAHRGNLRVHNHRVHQGDPYYTEHQTEPCMAHNPI